MANVMDVARYFLFLCEPQAGDSISNLKLQKLLYYAQGIHLARTGGVLFAANIRAWDHGPVVDEVYHAFKQYGDGPIPCPPQDEAPQFSDELRRVLDEVNDRYGQFSAWKLRDMTHEEPPWKETTLGGVIAPAIMRDYFRSRLIEECDPGFVVLPAEQFAAFEALHKGPGTLPEAVLARARKIGASVEFTEDGSMHSV